MILTLLLESGNGIVDTEDVLLPVRVPDATTLLSSILDKKVADTEVERLVDNGVIIELGLDIPEPPAEGPRRLVELDTGKGGRLEVVKLEIPGPAEADTAVDEETSVLPVPLGIP